jgi:hypothetical protein
MRFTTLVALTALSLTFAGCDRNTAPTPAPRTNESVQPSTQSGAGASRMTPPATGQTDSNEPAQNKDFKTDGK